MIWRFLILWFAFFIISLLKGGEMPVEVTTSRPSIWGALKIGYRKHVNIANTLNSYPLGYVQWKSYQEKPPHLQLRLHGPTPYGNFSRPINSFFKMKVNGIKLGNLYPKDDDVKIIKNKETGYGGCTIKQNYNGAKLIFNWYMRPDSPVLWLSIKPAKDSLTPVKSATINITVMPSTIAKNEKNKVIWAGAYERQAISPSRLINQSKKAVILTPEDNYLIFQDTKFDGSGPGKGAGPCFLCLSHQGIKKAVLNLQNSWLTNLTLELEPDFSEISLGFWQQRDPLSNTDFAKLFKSKQMLFEMKR
jgi:hypothetical protein